MSRLRVVVALCLALAGLTLSGVPSSAASGDVPQAVDDELVVESGKVGAVAVLDNDLGLTEGPFTITIEPDYDAWAHGLTVRSPEWFGQGGYVTFVADSPVMLQRQLTYTVTDADGDSDRGTINVTVLPYDFPVVAEDDGAIWSAAGEISTVVPLWNDRAENTPVTFTIETPPAHGTVVRDPDTNVLTYTPDSGYEGPEQLTYRLTDADGDTDTATVTWDIYDDHPVDSVLQVEVPRQQSVTIPLGNLSASFRDCMRPPGCSIEVIEPADLGSVTFTNTNPSAVQYTAGRVPGEDTFTTRVTDRDGDTAEAQVTVTVTGEPDPVSGDYELAVEGRSSNWIDLLIPEEQSRGISVTGCPESVHATITCDGVTMDYVHTDWWTGTEVLDYVRSDGITEQVTVTVAPRLLKTYFDFRPTMNDTYIAGGSDPFDFSLAVDDVAMPPNEVVQVQIRPKGTTAWKTVKVLRATGNTQKFRLDMPTVHHEFRLHHPASDWVAAFNSKVVPLTVVPRLAGQLSDSTGPGGKPITIDGEIGPVVKGQKLLLQRWSPAAHAYVTLRTKTFASGTASIDPGKAFSFSVTPNTNGTTYYQVTAAAVPGRAAATRSALNYRAR